MTDTIITKDTIHVVIGDDHTFNCNNTYLGRTGESNATQLEIEIPEEFANFDVYLDFKKPRKETVRTPRLVVYGNKVEYDIPLSLLDTGGEISVQVVVQDGNDYIWKSAPKKFSILQSIDAVNDIAEKEDFIANAQKLIDELRLVSSYAVIDSVHLRADKWEGDGNLYSQPVTISGVNERCKVDLNPSVEQLEIFYQKDLTFITENEDGVVTVYCIGQKPANDYTMQVTITEVNANG